MANPIPPLLCSTPPPIDFENDDFPEEDDFGDFTTAETNFDQHREDVAESLPSTPQHKSPHSLLENFKISGCSDIAIPMNTNTSEQSEYTKSNDNDKEKDSLREDNNFNVNFNTLKQFENVSELNIDLSIYNEGSNHSGTHSPMSLELSRNPSLSEDDVENFQSKYDDSTSLPSLKFESSGMSPQSYSPNTLDPIAFEESSTKHTDDELSAFQSININPIEVDHEEQAQDNKINENSKQKLNETITEEKIVESATTEIEIKFFEQTDDNEEEYKKNIIDSNLTHVKSNSTENISDDLEKQSLKNEQLEGDKNLKEIKDKNCTNESINEDLVFEADFSQFACFEPSSQIITTLNNFTENQSTSLDDVNDDFEDFDNFQDYTTTAEKANFSPLTDNELKATGPTNPGDSDDDDFGEFNDFTQTTSSITPNNNQFRLETLHERLKPLLDRMFPIEKYNVPGEQYKLLNLDENIIGTGLKQIDSTNALGYQWNKSNVRHSLITSVGIDSINILYGEKWNSSMPRYAANLSFNPLEPIKPNNSNGSSGNYISDVRSKTDVPAVEFDWNSSGLVNPLDGIKEIVHGRKNKAIHKTEHREPIESSVEQQQIKILDKGKLEQETNIDTKLESTNDSSTAATCSINIEETSTAEMPLTDIQIDLKSKIETLSILEPTIIPEPTLSDVNSITNSCTYNEPINNKGHILTPSKDIENRVTTKDLENKCPIDFDYEMAAAGIIIDEKVVKKEYRDIEYNPSFVRSETSGISLQCKKSLEESTKNTTNTVSECGYIFGENTKKTTCANEISPCVEIATYEYNTKSLTDLPPTNIHIINENLPNTKFIQDSSVIVEEEFSDFQSVPPPSVLQEPATVVTPIPDRKSIPHQTNIIKELQNDSKNTSRTSTPVALSDEMILSPAILLPQAIKINQSCSTNSPKIDWPEPGINSEELARLEEMFPQPKHVIKPLSNQLIRSATNVSQISSLSISQKIADKESLTTKNDEDDWSDFVSAAVPAVNQNCSYNMNRTNQFSKNPSPVSLGQSVGGRHNSPIVQQKPVNSEINDDEWSDFVSSTPIPANSTQQYNFTPSPQFNSAAWQNANFYNNPLSVYATPTTSYYHHQQQQSSMANNQQLSKNTVPNLSNSFNNNNYNNNNIINQQYVSSQRTSTSQSSFVPPKLKAPTAPTSSSIHVMQDFSTSQYIQEQNQHPQQRLQQSFGSNSSNSQRNHISLNKNQFINNKIVPRISLIPDHGFVAPQHHYHHHTHNIINIPKNNIQPKK